MSHGVLDVALGQEKGTRKKMERIQIPYNTGLSGHMCNMKEGVSIRDGLHANSDIFITLW